MKKVSPSLREGILVFLKSIIAILVYALAVSGVSAVLPKIPGLSLPFVYMQSLSTLVGGTGSMWLMRKVFDRRSIGSMGYGWRWKDLLQGIASGTVLILLGLGLLLITGSVRVSRMYWDNPYILQTFIFFVCVAVAEETCFRGYVVGNMADSIGDLWALFVSGILFSAPHLMNPNSSFMSFIGILVAGWFLAAAYVFTRNLWLPIGIHFGWNFVQAMVGFNVSGVPNPGVLTLEYPSQNVWNGGEFGFEASVVCVVLLCAATAFIVWRAVPSVPSRRR